MVRSPVPAFSKHEVTSNPNSLPHGPRTRPAGLMEEIAHPPSKRFTPATRPLRLLPSLTRLSCFHRTHLLFSRRARARGCCARDRGHVRGRGYLCVRLPRHSYRRSRRHPLAALVAPPCPLPSLLPWPPWTRTARKIRTPWGRHGHRWRRKHHLQSLLKMAMATAPSQCQAPVMFDTGRGGGGRGQERGYPQRAVVLDQDGTDRVEGTAWARLHASEASYMGSSSSEP